MTVNRYTSTAISLHWLIAILIAIAFVVGNYMADLDLSPWKLKVFAWHKWMGVTIFGLVLVRILWRLTHAAPALPTSMPALMVKLAKLVHLAIYVLMFVIPITGWLFSSAAGVTVVYLNLIPLPNLVAKNKELADTLKEVHETLNWTLLWLVVMHVVAALKHQFVDKDNLMARMRFK
jgi:cytochrome b561